MKASRDIAAANRPKTCTSSPWQARTFEAHGIAISMSRRGSPYDKAQAESFMKTLKEEEVLAGAYATLGAATSSLVGVDRLYNEERLHSALG